MNLFDENKLKGVAYYRFSAENKQDNSIENQREALEKAAAAAEVQVIDSFEDDGVTGLIFERPGFQAMLDKYVYAVNPPKIDYILFFDVSRIARVQRMSRVWRIIGDLEDKNIRLGSVDRGIPKGEMTVVDTIMLTLDFTMASDYSRLLSNKVFLGSVKVSEQGYSAGGYPPYGYERVLLDEQRTRVQTLKRGVHKELSNQRVTFEPAQTGEALVVNRIFSEFTNGAFPEDLADELNAEEIPTATGKTWAKEGIIRILTNETYTGTRIYNKSWGRLKEKRHANPQQQWVKCFNAHEAIVDFDTFHKAQERLYWLRPRSRNYMSRHIQAAKLYVGRYVEEVIAALSDDQKHYIRRHMPLIFAGAYNSEGGEEKVCFYIPPQQTQYTDILLCAIGIADPMASSLRSIYKLSSKSLHGNSYVVIDSKSDYQSLGINDFKYTILDLVGQVLSQQAPWLISPEVTMNGL